MNWLQPGSGWFGAAASRSAAALALALATVPLVQGQSASPDAGWRQVDLAQYRQHLQELEGVVTDCAAQLALKRPVPSADNQCDPNRVGQDDRVSGAVEGDSQPRDVRYDWLRTVLSRATNKTSAPAPDPMGLIPGAKIAPPTIDVQLAQALTRLKNDEGQARGPTRPDPNYNSERQSLKSILSQPAYKGVAEVSPRERFVEWFFNQLDKFLSSLARFGSRSPWIVWTLRGILLLGIGVGLVWAFLRIERGGRIKLVPDDLTPAPGAPSAREWQLWLKDAKAMAENDQWRDAIHLLYWAAISRLESRRMWPADRARTPREYLGLMPAADPRTQTLKALTRDFERTWYGGREAASGDFQTALDLAGNLGVKPE